MGQGFARRFGGWSSRVIEVLLRGSMDLVAKGIDSGVGLEQQAHF